MLIRCLIVLGMVWTFCAASATAQPPTDGRIHVTIKPDRDVWKLRETITGRLTIKNTGKQFVRFSPWWIDSVTVTNESGEEPESFSIMGCITPGPDEPTHIDLNPGEEHTGKFSVYTDRLHSMSNGYYLSAGKWVLRYAKHAIDTPCVDIAGEAATIEVRTAPGEFTGPRILEVQGAGKNLVLLREEGWVDVFDPETGKRLGAKRPGSYVPGWIWFGSELRFSNDGRTIAYCKDRTSPIIFETIIGDAPARPELPPPNGMAVGAGGFFVERFLPGDSKVLCKTNNAWVVMDRSSGEAMKTISLPEMWVKSSPDGRFGAWMTGSPMRIVNHRGDDEYRVAILDTQAGGDPRTLTIEGHGEFPELFMGATCVYLCDEFENDALRVPYAGGEPTSIVLGMPGEVVGESSDGAVVAFAWPRSEHDGCREDTTVSVFRTSDAGRLSTIGGDEPMGVAMVSDPPRIICLKRNVVEGDMFGLTSWLAEKAVVYDALTGKQIKEIDLTPAPGLMPEKVKKPPPPRTSS